MEVDVYKASMADEGRQGQQGQREFSKYKDIMGI